MLIIWLIKFLLIVDEILAVSYNQPKFCLDAVWDPNAITFPNNSKVIRLPRNVFVDINDAVYVVDAGSRSVIVFFDGDVTHIPLWRAFLHERSGLFVAVNGDIYISYLSNSGIRKWISSTKQWVKVTQLNQYCEGLFIDINDYIYCSASSNDQVVKRSLENKPNSTIIVAGNGTAGSLSHMLDNPTGIFVDTNLDLYVADSDNDRIQLFVYGQLNGITVAGNNLTIELKYPIGVVLDADKHLFIVEYDNHRIVRSGPNGFQCLFGCSQLPGSSSTRLKRPTSISFDSRGNIFVADPYLERIQKILLITNSCTIQLNGNIKTTSNDLYLPSKTLAYGTYRLQLTVNLIDFPTISSVASIDIHIIRSEKWIVNLIEYGTSTITLGQYQELLLEPGLYSFDGDGNPLVPNEWEFEYLCRIYALNDVSVVASLFSDVKNSSCFIDQFFENNQTNSTLTIPLNSFQSNRSYQFKVEMKKSINYAIKYTGHLLVHVQDTYSHRIAIKCAISTMCIADVEYQLINPTTQVALFSLCLDNCSSIENIHWNIYFGILNQSTNLIQWNLFNKDILTFGNNTNYFTISNELFTQNSAIEYWRFEVLYQFQQGQSASSMYFKINQRPSNGSCSITPLNGTITTLFTIVCSNWSDENEIKDYSFYVWTNDYSKRLMVGFSTSSTMSVRLPIFDAEDSLLNINVDIRDKFDCIEEYQIRTPVYLLNDFRGIENLIGNLSNGNQNEIGQIILIVSQYFKQINSDSLQKIVSDGIPLASVSISSLTSQSSRSTKNSFSENQNLLDQYQKNLNNHSAIRELMVNSTRNLTIAGIKSLIFQASSLVQTTEVINELTRMTSMTAAIQCYELAIALNEISEETSYVDIQRAASLLSQCTSNILHAINSPLQERTHILDLDLIRSKESIQNFDRIQMNEKEQNIFYQKQIANEIDKYINQTIILITSALNSHLNLGQQFLINQSEFIILFERIQMNQISNSQIKFPSDFSAKSNESILFRSKLQALAPYGNSQANTNLSRSVSFELIDQDENEIHMNIDDFIGLIIPRDPNLIIPDMILQKVKNYPQAFYYKSIHLKQLKPNENLTVSIHFEILSINFNLAYLFTYQLNNSSDEWTFFCPSDNESIYQYYIDNEQLSKYELLIFGLRELTSVEFQEICIQNLTSNFPLDNSAATFTENYYLRIYTSGCYYLDQYNQWQSDGLIVGSQTNPFQTQCFTHHF